MSWLIVQYEDKEPIVFSSLALVGMEKRPKILETLERGLSHLEALQHLKKWRAIYDIDNC